MTGICEESAKAHAATFRGAAATINIVAKERTNCNGVFAHFLCCESRVRSHVCQHQGFCHHRISILRFVHN